jgi:uncharacterized repeat protein (TIGR02543 family)
MFTGIVIPTGKLRRVLKRTGIVLMITALLVFNLTLPTMAAITIGSSTNANSGSGFTVTIAKPGGTVAGDVLVACIVATTAYASGPDVTAPDGWQLIRSTNAYQGWYYKMVTYYKVAGASEPAAYSWTSTYWNTSGGISRLTGVDINRVVDVSAEAQGQGDSPAVATAPSVTTNFANDIVINFFGSYSPLSSPYFTEQAGLNPLYEYAPPKSGSYDPPSVAAYNWTMTSAGSTGAKTCTLTSSINPVRWVSQTVTFKAAPRAYFPVASDSAAEADASRWIGVTLAPNAQGPVEINFTVSGTAQPGKDYTMITTSPLTVGTGSGSASIGFNIIEDGLYEGDETIIITLLDGQGYFLSGNTQYTYTITNDDSPAPSPVIATGASRTSVTPTDISLQVLQIPNPSAVAGDLLLAAITRQGSSWSQTINPPEGWTLIRETHYSNSQGLNLATYYKIAGSSEPTYYTWGIPDNNSVIGFHASGGITRYTGVDVVQPIDVSNAASGTMPAGASGTVTVPSVYPSYTNSHIVSAIGIYNPVTNIAGPAGMTEQYEIKHSIAPYNSMTLLWPTTQMSDMTWAPATGTGVKTASVERFLTSENTDWVAQTIALKTSQLSISDASVAEGNSSSANVAVTVSLDHPTNVPVTFSWLTADGTALAGSDYIVWGESNCTIPAGQTSYELIIPIYGDTTLESNETFYVNLTNVTGATVVDSRGAVTILNDDSSITINDVSQNEGNAGTTNFIFTVTLSPACSLPVSVTYFTPTEGTATQSTDYYYTPGTVVIPAGQTTATISVPVIGDTDFEPNETFVVYLSGVTNAKITDNRGTGTILNDDVQIPTLSINDVSKAEGNSGTSNMVFTVTLSAVSASNVSVNYATANGTAVAGSDYTLTTGTLNIPAGQTTGTISVPIIGDTTYEPNETFSVNLSSPTNATINDGTGIGTITNDDVLTMSINDVSLAEGNSGVTNFVFTITLNGASSSPVTVDYATANGTAVAGPDYNSIASATLTLNPGETSKTITIQVNGDTTYEADETFYVNLSNASGAVITDAQGLGTILNDDAMPTYALTMAVSPAGSGSATDQTGTSPYATGALININASPAPGYHFVNWTASAGSFADAHAASTSFTMPEQAVTVTANFALDTFTVSFDSQGGSAVPDQIVVAGEQVVKPANPTRGDYLFVGWYRDILYTDDWNFDNDSVTANITLYARWAALDQQMIATSLSIYTSNGTYAQTFTAGMTGKLYRVSCYLGNVNTEITLTTQIQGVTAGDLPNGTVLAGKSVNLLASQGRWVSIILDEPLSITAGQRYAIVWSGLNNQCLLYGSVSDTYAGGRALMISSGWGAAGLADFTFRTYVLTSPGITLTPADGLVTTETGGTDTFTVVLNSQPTADVTIGLSSSDTTEGTVSPASLTFTTANWNTPQTVTITGVDDDLSDGDIPYSITASASSADLSYHGMMGSANVTNTDVEGTAPVVSADPVNRSITYGDNTSFSAAATGIPSPTVQWQVSTDGGSSFANISDGSVYSGTTATTLNLTRPPVSYSGFQYRAVFSNGFAPEATTSAAALNVTALNITGSFTADNKAYDGATGAAVLSRSLTGVLPGDVVSLVGGTAAFADKNVGTGKTVTLTGATLSGTDTGNYNLTSVATATADITPKAVSPSIVANDKTYDGTTTATLSSQTVSGVLGSDDVTLVVGSATFADADVGTWTVTAATLSLSGADAGNYKLTEKTATDTAEITARNLTISGAVAVNKVYDGKTAATVNFSGASLAGVLGADSVSIDSSAYTAAFSDKNVGTNKAVSVLGVALSGTDAANYTVSQPVGLTANITRLNITGSFTADDKVYDGATGAAVLSRALPDMLPGDVVSLVGGTAAFTDKNVGTGKTVALTGATLSGADAANYNLISVANATADITPKPVSPSIVANDKTYDGTTTATLSSQTVSGVLGSDDVSLAVGSATFADADVGTWTVTAASLSLSGADAGNYKLTEKTATDTAKITARNLTISGAVAVNKVYDGKTAATVNFSGASLAGVLGTDSVSIDSTAYTAAFSDKNVGSAKPVTVLGVALSGADAANYTVSQPVGLTANITRLNITGSFTADDKVYDGTTAADVTSRDLSGVLAGDTVTLTGGTAAFADKNVGTGKTVTLTGATLSGTDAGNYNLISVANATANITPKLVSPSIVANDKTYDGTTIASLSSQTVSGVLGSDDVSLVVGSATFADADVGTWTVTAASLSLSGADAGNYKLTAKTATDTAEITARNLTISGAVAGNKTYDGTTSATVNFSGASLAGVLGTDSVSIDSTAYTAAFIDKNVGTNKAVSVLGVALSGADAANYTVAQPVGLTANITRLNITGSFTADNKVYDGATSAAVLSRALTGVLPGDVVSLVGGTAAFADKNVGTGKTVTLTGATLSGTDAGNYNLTSVANATADITVRPIVVTAVADTKVYDGTTASSGLPTITSATGLVAEDSANWSQTYDTKDAGTGKLLTPAGTINDGNGGNNYAVTFVSINTGVIEKAKLTVTAEDKTSQYSDPRLAFTAVISGFIPGETLATCGVTGSPSYTTSPALGDPITQAPGNYAIIPAVGTLAANNYSFIFVNGTYTVTKEAAVINFDMKNPVSVIVIASGGGNAAFTWQARITQSNDGNPGNLACIDKSNITLTFSAVGSGGGWTGTATAFDPETGLATFEIPADVLGVETYAARVTVMSSCFLISPAEEVLVIYDPSLGFTTGGGWFYWPEGTTNPELAGAKTTFGFTMKYNKKGNSVQGSFLLIAHLDDGSIIRIKSNAINGLAILQNTYPGIASFSGKCVYSRVDADGNVLVEAGNQDFTAYVQDMNEPGSGTDLFWFNTNLTIAGETPFSLDSNSNSKVDESEYVPLDGGNIVVPHKTSSADTGEEPAPPSKPRKK